MTMNSKAKVQRLLSSFSHAASILVYYGDYFQTHTVVVRLNKAIYASWTKHHKAYRKVFAPYRRTYAPKTNFDEQAGETLIEHAKYAYLTLKL